MNKKRCPYCGEFFEPNAKLGNRQKTCGKDECGKKHKQSCQKKWHEKNPTYFKNRYFETKTWLEQNPGYLKQYRDAHPEYVEKNRIATQKRREMCIKSESVSVDIQESILIKPQTPNVFQSILEFFKNVDIQESIFPRFLVFKGVDACLMTYREFVDIQESLPLGP